MAPAGRFSLVWLLLSSTSGCSNFLMNWTDHLVSGRSMDGPENLALGANDVQYAAHVFPRNLTSQVLDVKWTSSFGYFGITPASFDGFPIDDFDLKVFNPRDIVLEGINEEGLSCSFLTLIESKYEKPNVTDPSKDLLSPAICKWALERFSTTKQLHAALESIDVVLNIESHFVFHDGTGSGSTLVLELLGGKQDIYLDPNDNVNGFGILTNEPAFLWQLQNVKHLEWKRSMAREAVSVPGNFYPDERFARIHLVKQGLQAARTPTTLAEAVQYTTAVLNVVAVPMGFIPGTDTTHTDAKHLEGDHSQFQVVRVHAAGAAEIYFRTVHNPSWRRVALAETNLTPGSTVSTMLPLDQGAWFMDVSHDFKSF